MHVDRAVFKEADHLSHIYYMAIEHVQYARSDWLLIGHDFLVMTRHYENTEVSGFF